MRRLLGRLAREGAWTLGLLAGASLLVFLIVRAAPGDAALALGLREGPSARPSPASEYLRWVGAAVRGDFGNSLRTGRPVAEEIRRVGGNTLALALGALAVTVAVAVPIGAAGALRRNSPLAGATTVAAYALSALPAFFVGYVTIYLFTRELEIFPLAFGGDGRMPWLAFVLPMAVLGVANGGVGEVVRHVRAALERVLAEEYVRTARAKGASVWRHAAAEGLVLPVTASLAAKVPFVLGGAVVVEQVFNWPGLGRLAWQAALDRDYPVIMGLALLAAAFTRGAALAASVLQAALAPGARVGGEGDRPTTTRGGPPGSQRVPWPRAGSYGPPTRARGAGGDGPAAIRGGLCSSQPALRLPGSRPPAGYPGPRTPALGAGRAGPAAIRGGPLRRVLDSFCSHGPRTPALGAGRAGPSLLAILLLAALVAGCAGRAKGAAGAAASAPALEAGTVSLRLPSGWRPLDETEVRAAFPHRSETADTLVAAASADRRFLVLVSTDRKPSLVAFARREGLGGLREALDLHLPGFVQAFRAVDAVEGGLAGRPALYYRFTGTAAGAPQRGVRRFAMELVVVPTDAAVFTLSLLDLSGAARFDDPSLLALKASFTWRDTRSAAGGEHGRAGEAGSPPLGGSSLPREKRGGGESSVGGESSLGPRE